MTNERKCYIVGFEDGGRGREPTNVRNAALETGGKETDPPLEPPEGA